MKLLLLAENWPPRVGGIENYLHNIASHLPAGKVTVVAPVPSTIAADTTFPQPIIRHRFFSRFIRPKWLTLFIWLWRYAKKEQFDVVLCGKALFEGQIGYYLKKYLGIPYVVFTYAMEIETWRQKGRTRRQLERVLQNADRVIYINEITKTTLEQLGVAPEKLVKIWPGVDDVYFQLVETTQKEAVLKRYNIKSPYILCLTRLVARKGVEVLIDGFSQLDQTKFGHVSLVIAGDGPEKAALEALAEQNFVAKSVRFIGHVPAEDLPALYSSAEFFALTPTTKRADFEGFGIVYTEAAASGKTALGTSTGGVVEAVLHNETGILVQPEAAAAITEALALLLTDTQLRDRLAQAAQKRAYEQFRWTKRILLVKGLIDALTIPTAK